MSPPKKTPVDRATPRAKQPREWLYYEMRERSGTIPLSEAREVMYPSGSYSNFIRDHIKGLTRLGCIQVDQAKNVTFGPAVGNVLVVVASTTRVRARVLDASLGVVAQAEMKDIESLAELDGTHPEKALRTFVDQIAETVRRLYVAYPEVPHPAGIGIALPLAVDERSGKITDAFGEHFDVGSYLRSVWSSPAPPFDPERVLWLTDIAAAALGYMHNHPRLTVKNVLAIKASGWIRHAFIVDGEIVRGAANRGHAFGRLRARQARQPRSAFPSAIRYLDDAHSAIPAEHVDDHASLLGIRRWIDTGRATVSSGAGMKAWAADYIENVRAEDEAHRYSVVHAGTVLGQAVRDALCLLDPDAVLLTGHMVSELNETFVDVVREHAELRGRHLVHEVDPEVKAAGKSSTVTGIGYRALEEFVFSADEERRHLKNFQAAHGRTPADVVRH